MRAKTMLTGITRLFSRVQKLDLRCFLHVSAQAPQSNPVPAERPRTVSRTSDSDPVSCGGAPEIISCVAVDFFSTSANWFSYTQMTARASHSTCSAGKRESTNHLSTLQYPFLCISEQDSWNRGIQVKTFGEACLMVRKPALELLGYLKNTKFTHPAVRYLLYGEKGTGKTLSLCHAVHFCAKHDWLVLHIPDAHLWVKNCRELLQSTYNKERFDQPLEASTWLKNFKTTNKRFLSQIKVQGKYVWNKRESTEKGSPLGEVVEQGITRVRNATDAVGIVLKELRSQSSEGHFRLLVAVDGVNALWGRTTLKREDRTLIAPEELSLVHSLRKMVKNDWHGGAIVLSLSQTGSLFKSRAAYLPHELLGKEGFDALDPFLPILISNYNPKEFESSFQYYLENNWLQHERAPTEEGRKELKFLSNCNPGQLERLCAAL
ncbi:28S ribosomal protein S29, mitochondrial [Microtus ochrogaster]|uniref:Small ribosomal subunit protein mS29 n=1 Tax=Microtus ochrogaster TaxID=79684 RepID=A0ABM1USR1_MICOH|nr:28S ribosomal protein S29, mitochondrial [Microtus ochrogaster]